jgi:hypothetical protein
VKKSAPSKYAIETCGSAEDQRLVAAKDERERQWAEDLKEKSAFVGGKLIFFKRAPSRQRRTLKYRVH